MSLVDELVQLKNLLDSGAISDAEYATAKAKLLDASIPNEHRFDANDSFDVDESSMDFDREARQSAFWLHLSMLAGYVVPLAGIVGPVVIWQLKKDQYPIINSHGLHAVNWIISSIIYTLVSLLLCLVLIGIPMLIGLLVVDLVFPIIAAVKANNGEVWRYPMTIDFVKDEIIDDGN